MSIKKLLQIETKHIKAEKKLDDLFYEVKLISTKGLKKDLIYNYRILNRGKYFSLNRLENYFVFQPAIKYFKPFQII